MNNETSTKAVQRSSQSPILKCLVLLVFVVSAANIIIGHRSNLIDYMDQQYQQQSIPLYKDAPTVERTAEDTNDVHSITLQQQQQNDINGDTIIHDGAFITDILTDKQPFPTPQNNPHHHHHRLKFLPGTLHLTSAQSLQHCHVNTTTYAKHVPDVDTLLVSVSHKHKLIYRNVPKSSSSSARHAMQDFLEGVDTRMKSRDMNENVHGKNYTLVSFIRDPLQRFYSSYDEAFFRMGPWMGNGKIVEDKPKVKKWYYDNKYRVEKYPYLYVGFDTIEEFRTYYCPAEILNHGHFLQCNEVPSIDNGNLAHRFEQFVRDYSGRDPFDVHLNLQTTSLVFGITGDPLPISVMYNATEAERGWQELASQRGVEIPDGEMTHGRKITRRINIDLVSDETKRKICRLLSLDYCCLNIELPEVCRGMNGGVDSVYCAMKTREVEDGSEDNENEEIRYIEKLVIEPWDEL
mmetsp:Transcript_12187/g.26666  ORF Transcript_12187/g.26666 Transcript_12187/m.26666 type:complete len:462 (-) Transcript_12187:766-2151(-)